MVKMDAVCARALKALPDLRRQANIERLRYRDGIIDLKEYMGYVNRYKALRDALHHAGYLPYDWDDWDDGEV